MGKHMITLKQILKEAKNKIDRPIYRDSIFTDDILENYLSGYNKSSRYGVIPHVLTADVGTRICTKRNSKMMYQVAYYQFEPFAILVYFGNISTSVERLRYNIINQTLFDLVVDDIRSNSELVYPHKHEVDIDNIIFNDMFSMDEVGSTYKDDVLIKKA